MQENPEIQKPLVTKNYLLLFIYLFVWDFGCDTQSEHAPLYSYQNEILKDVRSSQHVRLIVHICFIISST